MADLSGYRKISHAELDIAAFDGDPAKRWAIMQETVMSILRRYERPRVMDLAMGPGLDTFHLLELGCEVVGIDLDGHTVDRARRRADELGLPLDARQMDWRDVASLAEFHAHPFDIVVSFGNSFPAYLHDDADRVRTLRGLWEELAPSGTLLFDMRNGEHILGERSAIAADPEHAFRFERASTYLGNRAMAYPGAYLDHNIVRFIARNDVDQTYAEVDLWVASRDDVASLIHRALGDVDYDTLMDYGPVHPGHYDFAQYILRNPS